MKYHKLGSSDLVVPLCCLGTMTWGEQNTEEEAWQQLDYALSRGVNFIDTAELYPVPPRKETNNRTEIYIGNWMKARNNRDKVIIATKVAGGPATGIDRSFIVPNRYEDPSKVEPRQPDLTYDDIHTAVNASLRRLQTTYIDLYQLHWPSRYNPRFGPRQYRPEREAQNPNPVPWEEQVHAVGDLIKQGKIRFWGVSNETTFGVCQLAETAKRLGVPLPVSIQNDFSLLYRFFEEELAEACAPSNYNIGLLCYGALAGGALTGKYLDGKRPEGARHTLWANFQPRYLSERSQAAVADYAAIAAKKGLSAATLAQAWAASRWFMGSVIIGATGMEQLKENIDAFDVELDQETLDAIEKVHLRRRNPNAAD